MYNTVKAPPATAGSKYAVTIAMALGLIIAFVLARDIFYPVFVMKMMCFILFAGSFNLLFGYAGLMLFGHAMFFGAGAFATGYISKTYGFGPIESLLSAMVLTAVLGAIVGYLALKRKGIEFAMICLALSELCVFAAHKLHFITGGENGLQNVPRGVLFSVIDLNNIDNMYIFTLVVTVLGMGCIWLVIHSPFGHVLVAIRDKEPRTRSLGINAFAYHMTVMIIAAALAGLAGGLKAMIFQFVSLEDIALGLSGQVILITLLGGLGFFFGPVFGAAIVILMESYLSDTTFPASVITGLIFILCVMVAKRGVTGEVFAFLQKAKGNTSSGS